MTDRLEVPLIPKGESLEKKSSQASAFGTDSSMRNYPSDDEEE